MNDTTLDAADPHYNAAVMASAGTGKTWLLVTRLIRLLLDGAPPDGLLAVTFTRKAAAEMQQRLLQRLRDLAECSDAVLDRELTSIGAPRDGGTRNRARRLYEDLLYNPYPLRITTFHAFCQELLRRFPLEADVPAGFEVLETNGLLTEAAWDALFADATNAPDAELAQTLEFLFEQCKSLHNTRTALLEFLAHRGDWWAFSSAADNIEDFAIAYLRDAFAVDPACDYTGQFLGADTRDRFSAFAQLLATHPTSTNTRHATAIHRALSLVQVDDECLTLLRQVLLTADGLPRARKASGAQEKSLTALGQTRFLELHDALGTRLIELDDHLRRLANYKLSAAWISAGLSLLTHYQRLKQERRQLDFADLEWKAYCLLTQSGNAHWIQYKLDQRIDHLLIDEFQDTNPTQWRLLLPLLEEITAGAGERARSLFLVGDAKQSIYRFRRADARLLQHAADWLHHQTGATIHDLDKSRRSAPAILRCVNAVFATGSLHERLVHFHPHTTYLSSEWGRVEVLPAPEIPPAIALQPGLRYPLQNPRPEPGASQHDIEAQAIAERIAQLVTQRIAIHESKDVRALGYQDIIILLRRRTHAEAYERALRVAGIPYIGAARGALLESLEIRDLVALLNVLIVPYDDLSLAQVLRSPVFDASDEDLMQLSREHGAWSDRLSRLGPAYASDAPLARAARLLERWRDLAGHLPVHDLLDRIYSEGNIPARYVAAFPTALRPRVRANLTRFIELALAVDSGRYPSLAHFLARVRDLRDTSQDAPDEVPPPAGARVRLMTIHAAKGLEAQAVFLADTGPQNKRSKAFQALVDWPAAAPRPLHFLLTGSKEMLDSVSRTRLAEQYIAEQREEANLLYVALTRAKRLLVISCAGIGDAQDSWYEFIKSALTSQAVLGNDGRLVLESGALPAPAPHTPELTAIAADIDPRLRHPIANLRQDIQIAPSQRARDTTTPSDEESRLRGRAIHRLLELLTQTQVVMEAKAIIARVATELELHSSDPDLQLWWQEAHALVTDPKHRDLFDAKHFSLAYNEIPIQYQHGEQRVFGIIDRLVRHDNQVTVIDYKTSNDATPDNIAILAQPYREQLHLYAQGARALWPGVEVRAALLFTRCREFYVF